MSSDKDVGLSVGEIILILAIFGDMLKGEKDERGINEQTIANQR